MPVNDRIIIRVFSRLIIINKNLIRFIQRDPDIKISAFKFTVSDQLVIKSPVGCVFPDDRINRKADALRSVYGFDPADVVQGIFISVQFNKAAVYFIFQILSYPASYQISLPAKPYRLDAVLFPALYQGFIPSTALTSISI